MPAPGSKKQPNPLQLQLNQLAPAFSINPRPYLELGGLHDNEDEEFNTNTPIFNVLRLSNGVIVVNDFAHLKIYSKEGKFLRTAGRSGRGPGEFTQIRELCRLVGDTILAVDLISERITMWEPSGKHLRTHARRRHVVPGSCTSDGTLAAFNASHQSASMETGGADRLVPHVLLRPDGRVERSLGLMPAPVGDSRLFRTPSIIPRGKTVIVGSGRTYEYQTQTLDGKVMQIVRFGRHGTMISDEEWLDRSERSIPFEVKGQARKERLAVLLARKPKGPEPAYSSIRIDPAGRIWIQDYKNETGFTIFDADGKILGRFELTRGLGLPTRIAGVGSDFIATAEVDVDGAIKIRFYKIAPM